MPKRDDGVPNCVSCPSGKCIFTGKVYRCVLNTNATHTVVNIESIPEVGEGLTLYYTGSAGLSTWEALMGLGCAVWYKVLGESVF